MGPKSILKKQSDHRAADHPAPTHTSREARNRELALHHARLIQQQKDVQAQVLEAIETLLDLPVSVHATAERPSASDASQFTSLLAPFQPGDYDALIEERNCAGRCGYALCPRAPAASEGRSGFRVVRIKAQGTQIVPRANLQQWCSEACARRALYVKVQLKEEPAWERRAAIAPKIDLLVEKAEQQHSQSSPREGGYLANKEDLAKAMADLALERSSQINAAGVESLITESIQENVLSEPSQAAAPKTVAFASHTDIEGYQPKLLETDTGHASQRGAVS